MDSGVGIDYWNRGDEWGMECNGEKGGTTVVEQQ